MPGTLQIPPRPPCEATPSTSSAPWSCTCHHQMPHITCSAKSEQQQQENNFHWQIWHSYSSAWSTVESLNHCLFADKAQVAAQHQDCWPPAPYSWKPKVMLILSQCHWCTVTHCCLHMACLRVLGTIQSHSQCLSFKLHCSQMRL